MRMSRQAILALAALALAPAVSFVHAAPGDPGAGLAATPHDFFAGPASGTNTQTVGLCTFCHTPHKAQSTRLLWNHALSANTFSWSDATTTTGGTTLPSITPAYQGASVRCLSCHDGTVAIGDVSWFKEQPWTGGALNPQKIDGTLGINNEFVITGGGTGGTDLKGNHPIAVPIPFGNAANTYNGNLTGTQVALTEWQADPSGLGIRLFNDAGAGSISAGAVAGKTGIECSSCHDPHNGSGVPAGTDFFLRGQLTGSDTTYICLKCHKK